MTGEMTQVLDPYAFDAAGLEQWMKDAREPSYRASQYATWLREGIDDPDAMTNLPAPLKSRLKDAFAVLNPQVIAHKTADDGHTHKLLLQFADTEAIEAVLMLYPKRATVCISTQAGCAMGCPFCATGQAGFRRQLTTGEIVFQVLIINRMLAQGAFNETGPAASEELPQRVTNVVFMGMGEPLANLEPTLQTVRYLTHPDGLNLSARHVTVSTVGLVPGITRLAQTGIPVTLAVSLHAATDQLRDELVPINRVHPLRELEDAMKAYRQHTNRRVSIEWCLIGDVNDSNVQADALAGIALRHRAHVNVIPMNPTPGVKWKEPRPDAIKRFIDRLEQRKVAVTLRDTRGRDADAACGQLLAQYALDSGKRLPVAVGASERVERLQP
jgi:23S rRNA (adenine2503-C2)-methyltransferase